MNAQLAHRPGCDCTVPRVACPELAGFNRADIRRRIAVQGWTAPVEQLAEMAVGLGHTTWRATWAEASPSR